jgi:catechol 2,3-dioxygenase-like lactoylglutathione lyase family enzyme
MQLQFITSIAIISPRPTESRQLFVETLGLPLEPAAPGDDYHFSEQIGGAKHFGVWPLSQAAEACFGTPDWPRDRSVPQVSIEFDVASEAEVSQAAAELEARGYRLLHPARTEPWGQTVARLQTLEGAIVGVSYAPSLHSATTPVTGLLEPDGGAGEVDEAR